MRYSWLVIALALVFTASSATAETWDGRWGIGIHGGTWKQFGGNADYSNFGPAGGLRISHGVSDAVTLDFGLRYGATRPGVKSITEEAGFTFDSTTRLFTRIWQPSLTATVRLVPDGTWRPWVSAGAGVTRWDIRDLAGEDTGIWPDGVGVQVRDEDGVSQDGHDLNLTLIGGLGTEIVFSDHWSLDAGVRFHYLVDQNLDSVGLSSAVPDRGVDANSTIIEGMLGINLAFGSSDRDGDGVPNAVDADPDRPEDFDGFQDEDGAPDPDNDGDGVPDVRDGAPNDPEDRDGFQDEDGVPDPDNDGDGVLDGDDVCPDTPADVETDDRGCPVAKEIKEDLVLEGVTFATSSAELTAGSADVLDKVAESLRAWPHVRIEVSGHSDSTGPADYNRTLSQQRAESVRKYLIDQGVHPSRIVAVGYGEERPIADNGTSQGRRLNRRVELKRLSN